MSLPDPEFIPIRWDKYLEDARNVNIHTYFPPKKKVCENRKDVIVIRTFEA